MAKINSKAKGKKGEIELCHYLEAQGFKNARRGLSQAMGALTADVECDDLSAYWIECKRNERGKVVYKYVEQAERDSKNTPKIPIVLYRANNKDKWLIIADAKLILPILCKHT